MESDVGMVVLRERYGRFVDQVTRANKPRDQVRVRAVALGMNAQRVIDGLQAQRVWTEEERGIVRQVLTELEREWSAVEGLRAEVRGLWDQWQRLAGWGARRKLAHAAGISENSVKLFVDGQSVQVRGTLELLREALGRCLAGKAETLKAETLKVEAA